MAKTRLLALTALMTLTALTASAGKAAHARADRIVEGHISQVSIPWHFPSNRIDWSFNPTTKTAHFNPEWTWQLNRMGFWNDLAGAYTATKDEKYAQAFVRQLTDWLAQTKEGVPPESGYNGIGSRFRTIEEGIRLMSSWPRAEAAFRASPAFTDDLRRRFVASMRAQANHLIRHRTRGNWMLMEMTGAFTFACNHPEFPESAEIRHEAFRVFAEAFTAQMLPDGIHNELSPDYQSVAFWTALPVLRLAHEKGLADEIPASLLTALERGYEGFLAMATPAFVQPRFNDCYTISTSRALAAGRPFFPARQDFLWGATEGREGMPPAGATASRFLPWAGFAVMRTGWTKDAAYLAFDMGPLGMAHIHQDKLSFTLWKGDQELVFDDGGGQYEFSAARTYGRSGYDHNTLLVDGLAQQRKAPRAVTAPIDAGWTTTTERDYARGEYDQEYGPKGLRPARHVREIVFDKKNETFIVTDTITSLDGKAHDYELLFHLDTTNTVLSAAGRHLDAYYGRTWNLALDVTEGGIASTVVGQTKPRLSGWYIGRNDKTNHPATTVSVRAPMPVRDHRFVTVLRPFAVSETSKRGN